ncbi:hypothetical protein D9M68_562220 [compost metagenome]
MLGEHVKHFRPQGLLSLHLCTDGSQLIDSALVDRLHQPWREIVPLREPHHAVGLLQVR